MPDSRRGAQRWSRLRVSGFRAGELLIPVLDKAGGRAEVDTLMTHGEYISAMRRARELTGLGLADAKRLVDTLELQGVGAA